MIPNPLTFAALVFWDFDGVVKDSVTVKSSAFQKLFLPFGIDVANRVLQHHEANGGVSRYKKIPVYLKWAGEVASADQVQDFCDRFSNLTQKAVIDSPWVPGVQEYLQAHHARQRFVIVTATPKEEAEKILDALEISHCFREVHGAPASKDSAIRDVLERWQCPPSQALVVGDSETDLYAAEMNKVTFLLRRTSLNKPLQQRYHGPSFDNLSHE